MQDMKQLVKGCGLCQRLLYFTLAKLSMNCNYILFTKLPWPGNSEVTFGL